ncbi:MAG: adenosylmethionine decarboxylase [Elusimicrobiota bacterium]
MPKLARHYLLEFDSCDRAAIDSPRAAMRALRELCREAPLHPLRRASHRFKPQGLTVIMILSESHLAFSTWPEYGYATLHLFLCGRTPKLKQAIAAFARRIGARKRRQRNWSCATAARRPKGS